MGPSSRARTTGIGRPNGKSNSFATNTATGQTSTEDYRQAYREFIAGQTGRRTDPGRTAPLSTRLGSAALRHRCPVGCRGGDEAGTHADGIDRDTTPGAALLSSSLLIEAAVRGLDNGEAEDQPPAGAAAMPPLGNLPASSEGYLWSLHDGQRGNHDGYFGGGVAVPRNGADITPHSPKDRRHSTPSCHRPGAPGDPDGEIVGPGCEGAAVIARLQRRWPQTGA